MKTDTPSLTAAEQIAAAELISEMIAQGYSSGEAIKIVADKIRAEHQGEYIHVKFDDEENDPI